jgi:hypothetical protein
MKINKIAEKFARYRHRALIDNRQINFRECFENPKDCLVLMPSDMNILLEAASKLPYVAELFPNRLIKILVTSNIDPRSHEFIKRFTLIKPSEHDLTRFSLPKGSFIENIGKTGLSVCVDLDLMPNFFNSSIAVMTGAPVRIGLAKGMGLPYYNLELNVGSEKTSIKTAYQTFVDMLYNLKGEGSKIASGEA